jgi:hypothetical protein
MNTIKIEVLSGNFKPFNAKIQLNGVDIALVEDKSISFLRKILYFTKFRLWLALNYELNILNQRKLYYLKRERIFKNDKSYFLNGSLGEIIYVFEFEKFKNFLKVDLTKQFKTAYVLNNSFEKIFYITTKFGADNYKLWDFKKDEVIADFSWNKKNLFYTDYNNCLINLNSNEEEHLLVILFAGIILTILKQKR